MLNSSFSQNNIYLYVARTAKIFNATVMMTFLFGCSTLKTREEVKQSSSSHRPLEVQAPESSDEHVASPVAETPQQEAEQTSTPIPRFQDVRLGVILGPGGAKTYGHIGVLKELQRRRIPVQMVAGLEWAALPAAIFASKGYANDVEWQMSKLKEEEWFGGSLLSSKKSASINEAQGDLKKIFANWKVENFRLPFVCPAWNMEKKQTYLMQKGTLPQLLPFCLSYPPLFQPYQKNVAGLVDMKALTDYMRTKGVNYILFINVLEQAPSPLFSDDLGASVAWSLPLSQYQKQRNGIDDVVGVNLREFQPRDFAKKREIIAKSADAAAKGLAPWAQKLGF